MAFTPGTVDYYKDLIKTANTELDILISQQVRLQCYQNNSSKSISQVCLICGCGPSDIQNIGNSPVALSNKNIEVQTKRTEIAELNTLLKAAEATNTAIDTNEVVQKDIRTTKSYKNLLIGAVVLVVIIIIVLIVRNKKS